MSKKSRHFHILKIIETIPVESQQMLLNELKKLDIDISQSSLSKDLKEMGLIKVRSKEGKFRFVQTKEREAFHVGLMLKKELLDFLTDHISVGNMVVLKTVSGNASGLAKCIDEIGWSEVVGTIAGDDTILVITLSDSNAKSVVKKLEEIISA